MSIKKYTLYIGLNDKDKKVQLVSTDKAKSFINNLVMDNTDGATVTVAEGVYRHENGTVVIENTIKVELLFTELETVQKIVDIVKLTLNQESVAVQCECIISELW